MAKFEIYRDTAYQYRWRLKAANGEVVSVSSEGYTTKSSATDSANWVRVNAPSALIIDLT